MIARGVKMLPNRGKMEGGNKMIKHTATPWKVGEIHGKRIKELWVHAEGYTCPVAYCNATNGIEAKAEANAHFIVKAVNCHDDLLTALKLAVHAINRKPNFAVFCENKNIKNSYAIAAICDKAIAKAESEG